MAKALHVASVVARIFMIFALLYFFICSLDLLSTSFKLIAGKATGSIFGEDSFLTNPVVGLMIGILGTVLVQSSSTFTSIIISMTGIILDAKNAVPMIMGANIGTSVTNTIVSLTQSGNRDEFRRAFAAATVHDMFNWCAVIVMLSIEVATGFLYHICTDIAGSLVGGKDTGEIKILKYLTEPLTDVIVQIDSGLISDWALEENLNCTMVEHYCPEDKEIPCWENVGPYCKHMFAKATGLEDWAVGLILLFSSLFILCLSLILMVKVLNSLLKGAIAIAVKKVLNPHFKSDTINYLWGYINIVVGAILTFIVQSSSVFTSTLTPLVGIGLLEVETVYPLFLGSNIGTTTTGLLSALAKTDPEELKASLTVAFVHTFFNIFGILIFYPIPFMRFPISLCKILGNTTAKYRWFAVFYLLFMFLILPLYMMVTSLNNYVFFILNIPLLIVLTIIVVLNVLQHYERTRNKLPVKLQNWNFLPKPMHSVGYYDQYLSKLLCCCKIDHDDGEKEDIVSNGGDKDVLEHKDKAEEALEKGKQQSHGYDNKGYERE